MEKSEKYRKDEYEKNRGETDQKSDGSKKFHIAEAHGLFFKEKPSNQRKKKQDSGSAYRAEQGGQKGTSGGGAGQPCVSVEDKRCQKKRQRKLIRDDLVLVIGKPDE